MFDIAFSEMLLIGVVALVVIGPERLPKVARTVGHLFGRLQRYVAQVKSDINREVDASELSKVKTEFESAARGFQRDVETGARQAEDEIRQVERDIERQVNPAEPAGAATDPVPTVAPEPPAAPQLAEPLAGTAASPQLELGIGEPAPVEPGRAPAAP
jgi:sec-independent protein translocase protein TatB